MNHLDGKDDLPADHWRDRSDVLADIARQSSQDALQGTVGVQNQPKVAFSPPPASADNQNAL